MRRSRSHIDAAMLWRLFTLSPYVLRESPGLLKMLVDRVSTKLTPGFRFAPETINSKSIVIHRKTWVERIETPRNAEELPQPDLKPPGQTAVSDFSPINVSTFYQVGANEGSI